MIKNIGAREAHLTVALSSYANGGPAIMYKSVCGLLNKAAANNDFILTNMANEVERGTSGFVNDSIPLALLIILNRLNSHNLMEAIETNDFE